MFWSLWLVRVVLTLVAEMRRGVGFATASAVLVAFIDPSPDGSVRAHLGWAFLTPKALRGSGVGVSRCFEAAVYLVSLFCRRLTRNNIATMAISHEIQGRRRQVQVQACSGVFRCRSHVSRTAKPRLSVDKAWGIFRHYPELTTVALSGYNTTVFVFLEHFDPSSRKSSFPSTKVGRRHQNPHHY